MKEAGYRNLFITHITQGELVFGAYYSQMKDKNLKKLWQFFSKIKKLPINDHVISYFGQIKAYLEGTGQRIEDHDIWNASFGKAYNMIVVTNNEKHFERIKGLKIQNWVKKK